MKKIGLLFMAGLLSIGAFAQENNKQKWEKPTPEKMAEFRTNRMKDNLGLTDEQYKKVYEINLADAKVMEAKMAERKAEHQKKADEQRVQMKEKRAAANAKYADVLTAEQMEKLNETGNRGPRGNRANVQKSGKHNMKGKRNTGNRGDFKKGDFKNKKAIEKKD